VPPTDPVGPEVSETERLDADSLVALAVAVPPADVPVAAPAVAPAVAVDAVAFPDDDSVDVELVVDEPPLVVAVAVGVDDESPVAHLSCEGNPLVRFAT
jgi:hypothetical protein